MTQFNRYVCVMNKRRLISSLLLIPVAGVASLVVPQMAQDLGRDFIPIVQTMAIIQSFEELRPAYILGGNLVLIYVIGQFFDEAVDATYFLYGMATFGRILFSFLVFGPVVGLSVYLSFFVNHDLNQSRLAVGLVYLGLLFVFSQKVKLLFIPAAFMFHYTAVMLLALKYWYQDEKFFGLTRFKRLMILLLLIFFSISILEILLPRYFVNRELVVPKNIFLYYPASLGVILLLSNDNRKIARYLIVSLLVISVVLVGKGIAGIYLGRFAELSFIFCMMLYGKELFHRGYYKLTYNDLVVTSVCLIVAAYQSIILSGNIWRFL